MNSQQDDRIIFLKQRKQNIEAIGEDSNIALISSKWFIAASDHKYSYNNFDWLGLPIIQFFKREKISCGY